MDGDADLVARVRRGDRRAFDDLYDRYADDVFSMCLVVLGDATVARAAAGTAFALVARTRMNPLSEPARLRSWLLELARGSALAWSGSPQARSAPVPHGISAEDMIDGAVVPAPASLRAGLARTFDRAANAAAHERAAQEHLAARDGYTTGPSALPIRTTGAAVAMAGAAAFAAADDDPTTVPGDPTTDVDDDATQPGATRPDVVGVLGFGAVAAAGLADAPTVAAGSSAAGGAGSAGSNLATAATDHAAAAHAHGGNAAQAADHLTKAAHETTKAASAHAHGGNAAQAADHLTKAAHETTKAASAHAHGGNAAQAAADHLTKAASHQPAQAAGAHGGAGGGHAAGWHGGNAADAGQQAQLFAHQQGAADAATHMAHLPNDIDPPTVDVDLGDLNDPNVVSFPPPEQHHVYGQYYADGQGAPLVPIDGVEGHRRHGPDWRNRPVIAVAASLVVAVAGITVALNWPSPAADLSAQNFPDVAIVAPSLTAAGSSDAPSAGQQTPPGPTTAPTVDAPRRPSQDNQPRLISDDRPIVTTTPAPPPRAGSPSTPATTPPAGSTSTSSGPEPTRTPTPTPPRTTPPATTPPTTPATTPPRTTPPRTTPPATPSDGGGPTTQPPPSTSAPATTPATTKTTTAPTTSTSPRGESPTSGETSSSGTVGSGTTADI